jgi:hypothetical protein
MVKLTTLSSEGLTPSDPQSSYAHELTDMSSRLHTLDVSFESSYYLHHAAFRTVCFRDLFSTVRLRTFSFFFRDTYLVYKLLFLSV